MTGHDASDDAMRVQRALLAHLRQEFIAPAAAIVGYAEILIEDARGLSFDAYLSDLERIRNAGGALHDLLQSVLSHEHSGDPVIFDQFKLRHDLRTPINAIKGYGEMLAEDAADTNGHEVLLADSRDCWPPLTACSGGSMPWSTSVRMPARIADRPPEWAAWLKQSGRSARSPRGRSARPCRAASSSSTTTRRTATCSAANWRAPDIPSRRPKADRRRWQNSRREPFDLILLDMMMPDISGYEVLRRLKAQATTSDIPVIMISALDDLDSVMRCIEAGAVDYLLKPFDPTLLRARIGSSVENKILRDREKLMVEELRREKARSEESAVVDPAALGGRPHQCRRNDDRRPCRRGQHPVRRYRRLHADGRPSKAGRSGSDFSITIFTAFDGLSTRFGGEKIKTIGDAYMVAFGFPTRARITPRPPCCRRGPCWMRSGSSPATGQRRSTCASASTPGRPSPA